MTLSRKIPGLIVTAAVLMLPLHAAAQSGTVTDDAFASANGTTQLVNLNGHGISLIVAGSSATAGPIHVGATRTFIRFQLQSSLPPATAAAKVAKATLKLYFSPTTDTTGAIDLYAVTGAWNESTLSPSSEPAVSATPFASNIAVGNANSFLVVDATKLVQDWLNGSANGGLDNDGIALVAHTGSTCAVFDSKESIVTSHEPRLEIVLATSGTAGTSGTARPGRAGRATRNPGPDGVTRPSWSARSARSCWTARASGRSWTGGGLDYWTECLFR